MQAVRTYLRYLVPFTLLSVIAFAPLILLALRVPAPTNARQAALCLRYAYAFAGCSVIPLFLLVGGIAPAARGIVAGTPRSQLAALGSGLLGLSRAVIPTLLALAAIAIGGLALALPGLILLVLLVLSGASVKGGTLARLTDSIATARPKFVLISGILAAMLALQGLAIFVLSRELVPLPKAPKPEHLTAFRELVRMTVAGIVLAAPIPAVILALIHARASMRTAT